MIFLVADCLYVYMAGQILSRHAVDDVASTRKKEIVIYLLIAVGILIYYKYVSLLATSINQLFGSTLIDIKGVVVPVGLSFVIFESVSYLVDIYRGDCKPGNFLECLTFITFFPKIVSGPIVLWKDFRAQIAERTSSIDQIVTGVDRIIVGFAKKAILADTFAVQITQINNAISSASIDTRTMWLKVLLYSLQLYFDFAGYSDIAIGLCNIFGFRVKKNFSYPYLSQSITEFWRRWHISLGTWFREYVYIPLGGNRKGNVYLHLLVVFLLTGLWHGTGWQFVIWGLAHGLVVVVERVIISKDWYNKIPPIIKWLFTTFFVCMAWVLFMSKDMGAAIQIYSKMFVVGSEEMVNFSWRYFLSNRTLLFLVISILGQLTGITAVYNKMQLVLNTRVGLIVKRICLLLLFVIDIFYVVSSTYKPFIYFQF